VQYVRDVDWRRTGRISAERMKLMIQGRNEGRKEEEDDATTLLRRQATDSGMRRKRRKMR
jgi:hypothetical protein